VPTVYFYDPFYNRLQLARAKGFPNHEEELKMAQIETFDHCGFIVEDIPRAERFYKSLFGARTLHIANLNTRRAYNGWPIIMFMEMGDIVLNCVSAAAPCAKGCEAALSSDRILGD
jgi:hypothetical protein